MSLASADTPAPPDRPLPVVDSHALPLGTRLGEFEVTGVIGQGGFGIVYLAQDHSLHRQVALKEYMPGSLASRVPATLGVAPRSEKTADTFQAGLRSFVNEARLLARFDHPALVKVYRFWEANGTAYMVMPYYQGPTLKAALAARTQPPDETTLRSWLDALLDALAVMHEASCFHRDIAPDNILLTESGPLLLDFGAARRVVGDINRALTVVLKPGYAPIEQYAGAASMAQGAWTDLYALACVVHYAILGRSPTSSVERLLADPMRPLSETAAGRYGAAFLCAVDAALAVRPEDRPQSVAQFRALLDADPRPDLDLSEPAEDQTPADPPEAPAPPACADQLPPPSVSPPAAPTQAVADPTAAAPAAPPRRRTHRLAVVVTLVILAGLAGASWHLLNSTPRPEVPQAMPSAPLAAPAVTDPGPVTPPTPQPVVAEPSAVPEVAASGALPVKAGIDRPDTPTTRPPAARDEPLSRPPPGERSAAAPVTPPVNPPVTAPATVPATAPTAADAARCSEILQKASLESPSAAELEFLKKVCR